MKKGFFYQDLVTRRKDTDEGIRVYVFREIIFNVDGLRQVRVPVGTESDLNSFPRILWIALPPTGQYDKAGIVHDYLYRGGCVYRFGEGLYRPSRKEADQIYYEALKALDIPWALRRAFFYAVRAGGGKHYVPDTE